MRYIIEDTGIGMRPPWMPKLYWDIETGLK